MNRISISEAWSYATGFFSGQAVQHAIVLIGVGIAAPLILQLLLGGGATMFDPAAMVENSAGLVAAMGATGVLLGIVNYVLQTGSYFASWRIGLTNGGEPVGAALGYGMIASLPVLLLAVVVVLLLGIIGFLFFGSALTTLASGGEPSSSALMGIGVAFFLIAPLFLLFLVWLAARLCCTGPYMADQRSYNVLAALGASWRMTAASQWKIFAYFILLGVALIVIFMILGMIVGVSLLAGGAPGTGSMLGLIIGAILLSVPMAYLQVGVPAGLYRALGGTNRSDVFA
ncbi:MAG: hypothetical protein WA935_03875 [Sphingopyxis granuli]